MVKCEGISGVRERINLVCYNERVEEPGPYGASVASQNARVVETPGLGFSRCEIAMLRSESGTNQDVPLSGDEQAETSGDGPHPHTKDNIEEIINLLETTDWRHVPSVSIPEAATLTDRLCDARDELEAQPDVD